MKYQTLLQGSQRPLGQVRIMSAVINIGLVKLLPQKRPRDDQGSRGAVK